jgi:hypothetical protein
MEKQFIKEMKMAKNLKLYGPVAGNQHAIVDDEDYDDVLRHKWRMMRVENERILVDNDIKIKLSDHSRICHMRDGQYAYRINKGRILFLHDYVWHKANNN